MFGSKVRARMAVLLGVPIAAVAVVVVTPQLAVASNPKTTPVPVVLSFSASKTSIPNAGGSIALKAKLKYASSCKITVSPSVAGFPRSFSCSSDATEADRQPQGQ